MTTYKAINFKRDYEMINVKFIQVLDNDVLNDKYWQTCKESEIDCEELWKQGNKIMFGYL